MPQRDDVLGLLGLGLAVRVALAPSWPVVVALVVVGAVYAFGAVLAHEREETREELEDLARRMEAVEPLAVRVESQEKRLATVENRTRPVGGSR